MNGTSAANKVVTNALLTRGDLVLFDRNNHKSNHHGALIQAGATPVYLEASRNPFGFIGGIDAHCFNVQNGCSTPDNAGLMWILRLNSSSLHP
ncbi:hypothetical protein BK332_25195 [Escherichia coli]|nr:hypothetical protein BK332_25195 [Escherichia coli]